VFLRFSADYYYFLCLHLILLVHVFILKLNFLTRIHVFYFLIEMPDYMKMPVIKKKRFYNKHFEKSGINQEVKPYFIKFRTELLLRI
jgi:hypothetical protein